MLVVGGTLFRLMKSPLSSDKVTAGVSSTQSASVMYLSACILTARINCLAIKAEGALT